MDILLKSAKIIDEESAYHGAVKDILISDGVIKQISNHIAAEGVDKVLENTYISQGWTDSSVCFGEPGFEERETLENGMLTAQRSGFTHVLVNTITHPLADNKKAVMYIK